jgi:hypothetical protein
MRFRPLLAILFLAVAFPASARSAERALWYDETYNSIGRTISNVGDMQVVLGDDTNEWSYQLGQSSATLGFVCIYCYPDDWRYHRMFMSPSVSSALGLQARAHWWDVLANNPAPTYETVVALITFIHEAYHWRLYSADESRVQACAIRDLPYWLENQFRVPSTVQQTQTVPQIVTKQVRESYFVKKRVKRNGKWVRVRVRRYRWVTVQETVYVQQVVTVPNPVFLGVVNSANAIHAAEAPPYGGGTCY